MVGSGWERRGRGNGDGVAFRLLDWCMGIGRRASGDSKIYRFDDNHRDRFAVMCASTEKKR